MRNIINKPFLLFLPFLFFYILIIMIFHTDGMKYHGDESRYYEFAEHILHGFYSPPPPNINLTNGPGYPLAIAPLLALGVPLIGIKLLNSLFYYLSVVLLFKSLQQITSIRKALIFSLFWAFYYNSYQDMLQIVTETFAELLITLIIYTLIKAFTADNKRQAIKYSILCGSAFGYLVLTKIIFGYVLLFLIVSYTFGWVINRKSANQLKAICILLTAFVVTLPYLIYTYTLTGRILYWGTPAGDSLYWMSTPYENEYGNWYGELDLQPSAKAIKNNIPGYLDSLKSHHEKDYDKIFKFNGAERDEAFRRMAFENIKSHPIKYINNCISNIGRLLFSFPYSYSIENNRTLFRLPLNGILVVFSLFSLIPTFISWRKVIFPIKFILFFLILYLGGSILVSTQIRMFTIIVPMLLFWISFIIQKCVKVNFKFNSE